MESYRPSFHFPRFFSTFQLFLAGYQVGLFRFIKEYGFILTSLEPFKRLISLTNIFSKFVFFALFCHLFTSFLGFTSSIYRDFFATFFSLFFTPFPGPNAWKENGKKNSAGTARDICRRKKIKTKKFQNRDLWLLLGSVALFFLITDITILWSFAMVLLFGYYFFCKSAIEAATAHKKKRPTKVKQSSSLS